MKVGDLVRTRWTGFQMVGTGVVLSIKEWVDSGAPDRNFGVTVEVVWGDGTIRDFEEDELEIVSGSG